MIDYTDEVDLFSEVHQRYLPIIFGQPLRSAGLTTAVGNHPTITLTGFQQPIFRGLLQAP
jgi:hypothetical protein